MPDLTFEKNITGIVAGVDEAGRGPCAGPVVAGAVILPENIPDKIFTMIDDSKKLSQPKREKIYDWLQQNVIVGVGQASVMEIDQINILQATMLAMQRAVENLSMRPDCALIDGNRAPKLFCATQTIIKGDSKSLSIAAASIIAKVTRDQIMQDLAREFPIYGWDQNAGYGTAAHLDALAQHGATIHHRATFAPVRKILETQKLRANQ